MRTFAAFALMLLATSIAAQTSGTWMYTGNLNQARFNHSAVLLNTGKVLVFGGQYALRHAKAILLSELYDPATGVWTSSGSSNGSLEYGTATLLPNGKVLATRGCIDNSCNNPLGSAELYDPTSGTWSLTGSMVTPREYHTATLLTNGKVLVAGGCYSACGIYNMPNAELYDPATGQWSATGSMSNARAQHTATLLPNGKVLVAGGISGSNIVASAEIYDPTSGIWSPAPSMANARRFAHAALLTNGKVLVMGGQNLTVTLSAAETYDPLANKWSSAGKMSSPRLYFAAAPLPLGKILAVGGADPSNILASADIYDPATGRWSATGSMNLGRIYFTATALVDGRVLAAAGNVGDKTAELYQP
jgi:N-acetylneuraminic acid mutarotase